MPALYNPPLQVVKFIGSKAGDAERGPEVRINSYEAHVRALNDNEYVWVYGPRRHDLCVLRIDDSLPRGGLTARDIAGVMLTDVVTLVRPHGDRSIITGEHA
jgi:hypothetical protein